MAPDMSTFCQSVKCCSSRENNRRRGQRHNDCLQPFSPKLTSVLVLSVLSLAFLVLETRSHKIDPINEFSNHDVFEPRFFFAQKEIQLKNSKVHCSFLTRLRFTAFSKLFDVKLVENSGLTPPHYFERYHENGSLVVLQKDDIQANRSYCHFKGKVQGVKDSWAALSTRDLGIDGVISEENEVYYIHHNSSTGKHFIFPGSHYVNVHNKTCGVVDLSSRNYALNHERIRRSISIPAREPYKSDYKSRYVELVIVNDHKEFLENNQDKVTIIEKSKRIANIVNALYNQLNIYVALVGVVIWSNTDEIKLSSDGDKTLTNFLRYRRERLLPQHPNDNAQLITATSFDGGVVGKALKGPICTYEFSGGVNTDHSHVVGLVATTVAHELGHNFGMEHDTGDKCKCPEDKCIMSPSSGSISPKHWSSCSVDYLNDAFSHGMDYCLRNPPSQLIGPVCGNGFVEEGEECDCGLKEFCDNPCCNPSNCTLANGAKCAAGACCNISSCDLIKSSAVCRKATSECDIPEFCDGHSAFCPEDLHIHNGVECGSHSAYCYDGECKSHNLQCKLLWGSTGNVSDLRCFKQNTKGTVNGNCGYHRVNQTWVACRAEDVLCGMLHCAYLSEKLFLGTESAALLSHSYLTVKGKTLTCRTAVVDLGLDSIDPGLAPNGAKCGLSKMCVSQRCVPVESVLSVNWCEDGCNGNGFCDNKGNCHCFEGFAPPNCESPLPHGYHLTLALYIIFLCILPLTSFSAFVAYYFHEHIKTWWIVKARKAAIKTRAREITQRNHPKLPNHFDVRSLEISDPIPVDNLDDIDFSTLSRNNRRKNYCLRESFRNKEISSPMVTQTSNTSSVQIKPIRPAPPPPGGKLNRSHSTHSSFSSRRSSFNTVRPKSPPPPCPGRPATYSCEYSNTKSDFSHDIGETQFPSTSMVSEGRGTSLYRTSLNKYEEPSMNSASRVAALTQQFESKK